MGDVDKSWRLAPERATTPFIVAVATAAHAFTFTRGKSWGPLALAAKTRIVAAWQGL